MKKWIISLNLLYYITILNQWNGAESNPTSSSTGSPTSETAAVDSGSTESTPAATTLTHNDLESISTTPDATQSSDTATTVATPIALDIENTQSTSEFDFTDENGAITFTPKDNHLFSKVSQGTKVVWESSDGLYSSLVRTKTVDNKKFLVLLLTDNMFKVFHEESDELKDITSERHDLTKLKFLGENDTVLTSSDYTVSINYFSYEFKFNDGVNCKKITYCDDEVWKHTDDPKFADIKSFRLGLVTNNFFVLNESDSKQVVIKVSLNLNNTESTSQFDYTDHNAVVTYTTKDGYVFNKIVDGTTGIWESKDDVFGTLVMSKTIDGVKYLSMLLQDNSFKVFHLDVGEWKDITSSRHDPSKLRFYGENDTEITKNDFTVSIADYSYRFTFNSGVKCKKIKFGNDDVWKHTDDPKFAEIMSFSLDLPTNKFLITNLNDQSKQVGIKVTLDISKTTSTDEFDYADENEVVTYTPKPGNVFEKIVKKGLVGSTKVIWESKDNVFGTLVRIKVTKGVKYLAIFLDNIMFILFHEEAGTWLDITSSRPDVTKLKFLTDNDTELTSSNYTVIINYFSYEYKFDDGVKCKKILLGEEELWKHSDDPMFAEIKSFRLGFASNNFFVTNSTDQTKHVGVKVSLDISKTESTNEFEYSDVSGVVTYTVKTGYVFNKVSQGTTVVWVSKDNVFGTLVMSKTVDGVKYLAVLMTNSMFKLFNHYYLDWHEITTQMSDVSRLKFIGDNDTELSSSDYTVSLLDLSYTYLFNTGVKCKKIMLAHDDLWKHDDDSNYKSIKSLSLDLSTNKFYVKNQSDQTMQVGVKISLDIFKTESTSEFDYIKDLDFRTYTPKPNYLFNKISHDTIDIWESKNNLYATLICIKPEGDLKYLAMLFQDNMFKLFHEQEDKPWENITTSRQDVSKLRFLGNNDAEISKTDYTVTLSDLSFTFLFKSNVKCKKIKLGEDDVWSHTDDTNFGEIKSFHLDLPTDRFFVKNQSDEVKKIERALESPETETLEQDAGGEAQEEVETTEEAEAQDDDGTVEEYDDDKSDTTSICSESTESISADTTDKSVVTKVTLDIEKTESTDEFDYTDRIDLITYTSKDNHVFSKITQGTKEIWKSKSDVHGTMVKIKTHDDGKYLAILLQNNSFVLLKLSDIPWKDITSEKHDITKLKFFGENDVELTKTDYMVTISYLSYKFTFNSGVNCRKITHNKGDVWKHSDDKDFESLMSFHQDLLTNKLYVMNSSYQTKEVGIKVTLDIYKSKSTNQFNFLKNGNFRTYTPKPGYLFSKIMKKGLITSNVDIWDSKEDHGLKAVLMGSEKNSKYLSILIQSGTFVLLFKSGKNKNWVNVTSERPDVTKLKFLFENDVELYSSDYDRILFEPTYGYIFNSGVNCKYIKYSDEFVWKHTDDPKFKSINIFYLDLISNKLFVKNSSNHKMQVGIKLTLNIEKTKSTEKYDFTEQNGFVTYKPKPGFLFNNVTHDTTDIWESKPGLYGSLVMTKTEDGVKYIAILMTNNEFLLLKLSGNDLKDITSERPDLSKLKFLGDNDTEITESDYEATIENDSYTIQFDDDVKCKKIKYGDDDLWTHTDDSSYSDIKSFQLDIFMNRFSVTNSSNNKKQVDIKVTLDLEKTETTDKFEYIKDGDCEKYSPKPGYVFNKISEGTTGIWESKDNVNGSLVRTMTVDNNKYISILLTNDSFILFHEDGNKWKDITSQRHDVTKLKFFGDNNSEITSSDYSVTLADDLYEYKFKDSVKCKNITYNDMPVWKHTDDQDFSEIKSFSLDLPNNKFSVTNSSDKTKQLDIKIILDLNSTQSTTQFDYTDENGLVTYRVNSGYVFNKVTQGNTAIWESKDAVYGTLARTKSKDNVKFLALLLDNYMFLLFHLEGGKWTEITDKRPDVTKLRFLGQGDAELTLSDYSLSLADLSYQYKFNSGVNCQTIKYDGRELWTHTDHAKFSEIKSLSLDLPTNKFIVTNSSDHTMQVGVKVALDVQKTQTTNEYCYLKDDDCHTFTPKSGYVFSKVSEGTTDIWESTDCVFGTLVRTKVSKNVKYIAMLLTNDMFKVFKESDGTWTDVTNDRRDVTRLKFIDENNVELSKTDHTVTIVNYSYQFKFNDGAKCKKITYYDDDVWKDSDDPKYSEIRKFQLGLISNNFFVLNASEFKKVGIKICLDIQRTESTEKYYFNDQNGLKTFTPNSGYVFTKISDGTKDIWESKTNVNATLVRIMIFDNKKYLVVLLDNNTFLLFNLDGECWKDITSDRRDVKKLIFLGDNNSELKSSDYKVTLENDSFTYLFNDGVKCKMITYSDLDVWKHTDDKDYSEIKSFSLGLPTNKFSVTNTSDHTKPVDVKVTLDIEKTSSTDHFEHSKDDKIHTYTPKDNYVFNKIIKKGLVTSTVDIWESKNDLCCTLVVTKDESGLLAKDKHLAILLKNNTFVLLHSSDKGKNWKDITSDRHDVTKLKFLGENDTPLTSSDYTVTLQDLSYTIKFNTDVNCKKITYNDITIWTHADDSKFQSIKSLHLDLLSNKFSVINSNDQSKELKDITMVSLDIEKTQSTSEFDFTDKNGVITYTPKSSHVFSKVSQGTTVIWESSNDIQCTLATIRPKDNVKYLSLLLKDNMFKLFKLDGTWAEITSQRHDLMKLKFLGDNDTPISKSDYTVTLADDFYKYKFKDSVKCKNITFDNMPVWSHTDDQDFSEIRSFSLGLPSNKLYVTNTSDQTKEVDIKVTLDLNATQSTTEFDYCELNELVTYTPKDSRVFDKVSQGTTVVWESTDNLHGSLVMSKTKAVKFLAVLMTNSSFKLFREDDGEWKDITNHRHDITNLRFLGDNDTPLRSSDYTVDLVDLSYTILFNTNVKCKKITHNDNPLWTHSDDTDFSEIKSLSLDLPTNKFYVTNSSDQLMPVDIKVFLDINKTESTDEFDYSDQNGVITYTPKDSHVFNKVVEGTTDIWQSKNNLCGTLVMSKTLDNKKYLAILLNNNMFTLFHLDGVEWKDITDMRLDITKLKFLGDGDTTLSSSYYTVSLSNLLFTYIFNSGVNCRKITYNDNPLWTHSDDSNFSDINSLSLDLPSNKFLITNLQDQSKELSVKVSLDINATQSTSEFEFSDQSGLFTYTPKDSHVFSKVSQGTAGVWESKNDLFGTLVMSKTLDDKKFLALFLTNNMFTLFHLKDGKWKDITSERHDVSRLRFFGEGDVELKSLDYKVDLVDLSYTYLFKTNVKCKTIKYSDNEVWKHTDDPNFSDIKSLSLDLPKDQFSVTNTSDQTKDVDIKVLLNLDTSHSTDEFYYSDQNGVVTYTPKSSHVFNKIVDGTTVIWESKNNLFGTLVMSNTVDDVRFLAILLTDNTFVLFNLESDGTFKDITSEKLDLSKLKFLNESDTQLKSSDYKVKLVDLSYEFTFNDDVMCKKITYSDLDVWKYTDDQDFSDIKSFSLDLPTNKFYVENSNDQTKQVDIKVSLDIQNTQSTSQFDFADQSGVVTFKPKSGHVFSKVTQGTTDICQSTDDVFGTLVRTKVSKDIKYLAMLLQNNMFTVFKESDGTWDDLTDSRRDVSKLKFLGENDTVLTSSDYTIGLHDLSYEFTFNTGVNCMMITYSDNPLWTYSDDPDYPEIKSLSLDLPTNKFSVTNTSNNKKELNIKVTLDLNATQSTTQFDYTDDNGLQTFTPKSGYMFNKVVQGTTDIWESTDDVHASLVRATDDQKFLVVLLDNNMFTLFHLENNEWTDITFQKHNISKLKFLDENDSEITSSHYKVTLADYSYQYIFNSGVKCVKITYNDNLLWNHTDDPNFSDIKSLQLDLPTNKFIIKNQSDETKQAVTKVTLNIQKTQSTDDFDYSDQNGVITYTPKYGHVFNKVVYGTNDIWLSKDNVHGTLICIKPEGDLKYLAILLSNNTFKFFNDESGTWDDLTSQMLDVTKLRFFGDGDTPLRSSDYTIDLVDLSYTYKFNTGIKCNKVTYSDLDVWNHTDDTDFSDIRSLQLDLPTNKLYVTNSSDQLMPLDVKVTLDLNKTDSTDEFDYTDENGLVTFTAKPGHVFSKVSEGPKAVWVSKDSVFGTLVRTNTVDGFKYLVLLMTNNTFTLFKEESDGDWKDITSQRYDIKKLKFFGDNDIELSKTDYKVDLVDLSFTYLLNSGIKCRMVKLLELEVWKHSEDSSFAELKSLSLDLPTNKLYVTNTSDETKQLDIKVSLDISKTESTDEYNFNDQSGLFTFKPKDNYVFNKVTQGSTDIWQSKNNLYGILVMSKTVENDNYLALLLTNNMFLLFHQDQDGNWTNITAMRHDIKKLKFLGDGDNPLSNSDYTVTIVDLSYQYKFNTGVKCNTVKLGEGDLWTHTDDSEFSEIKSLSLDLPSNKFFVTNPSDQSIQLAKARVPLDIHNTHSTNECHYSYDHDIHTFTPKPNYVFTKVTQGTNDIWESKTDVHGTLAKLKSMDEGNKKYLLLLLDNNKFKLFHEVSGQWHDITSKRHDLTKLKFLRDGNTELTSSDYSVSIVDYSYEYKFNTGVRCRKIMLGEEELWKHSDDTDFQSIKSLSLDLLMNKFFVKNSTDKTKQLGITVNVDIPKLLSTPQTTPTPQAETAPGTTTQTPETTPESEQSEETTKPEETPETKPVTTPETTEAETTPESTSETAEAPPQTSQTLQAKSTYEPVYQTLTAKSDNLFDKVSDGNTVVWESNDDVCGTMVSIKSDRKEIHLAVLLQDNDFVLVHKDNKDDTWKDVTSERADVTNLKFLDDTDTELSPSDYTVTIVDLSYEHKFNEDVKCHTVKYGEDEVWTHTDDKEYSKIKKLSLDLPSNKFSITNLDDQRKELTTTFTRVSVEIKKKDPNRQYDYSKSSNFHKFTPKDGNLFTKVSKGSDVVWDSKVEYVTLVNIKTLDNKTYLSMLLQNNSFVVLKKSDSDTWNNVTSKRYDITKLRFFADNDTPLTKNDYTTTIADCSYRFKFNTGVICKTIKYGDDDVWKHDDDTNFSEITILDLNLTNNKFSVTNNQSNSKELDYNGPITPAETTPADTSKPKQNLPRHPGAKSQSQTSSTKPVTKPAEPTKFTLITLDISTTQSTDEFEYIDQNGLITFTAKDNHVFSKVVDGNKVVWQTKSVLYGTELMYIEGVRYLVVQLQDNTFKLFVHFAGIWTDITHKRYDIKKLKFIGDNDVELTSSDYKITIFRFFYTFTFDDNVKCKKIKYGEDDVWKHDDDPDYSEIKKFQIGLASNESFVFNNKFKSKKLDYKPETPKTKPKSETPDEDETTDSKAPETPPVTEPTPVTPTTTTPQPVTILTVDIDKTQSTDDYDYILEH